MHTVPEPVEAGDDMHADKLVIFQAEDGIRDYKVTGVQTCALPISRRGARGGSVAARASSARRYRTSSCSASRSTTMCVIGSAKRSRARSTRPCSSQLERPDRKSVV